MKRVRAMLLISALGLVATARADETDWKPAGPTPATPPPAAAAPVAIPTPPSPPAAAAAPVESSGWRPAMKYPPDFQPQPPAAPVPTPASSEPAFRPTAVAPAADPPRELAPAVLPPINPIPTAIEASKPVDPLKTPPTPSGEALPQPKPVVPPVPAPTPPAPGLPPSLGSGIVPTPPDCPLNLLPTHPGVRQTSGEAVAPSRGRTFGTPPISLSRDFHFRDLFGLDLNSSSHGSIGPDGAVVLDGPPHDLFFVQAEYLLWWTNRSQIPALATTSTSGNGFGFLGDPDTRALLGAGDFGQGYRNGMRVRAGGFFDECDPVGVDGSFFFLGTARRKAAFESGQFPVITRPFFAPNLANIPVPPGVIALPGEFGEVVARPGLSSGRFEVEEESHLWGADLNYKRAICRTCEGGRGWFVGYRHVNLTEGLRMTEFLTATGPQAPDPLGTRVVVQDSFGTRSRFHGGQLGYYWNRRAGRLDVDARVSVALGVTHQILDIDGFQQRTRPGPGEAAQVFRGGLLATGPNIGRFTDNRFSVVPEATLNVGYMISPSVRLYAGYNFMYWNNVIRPGDQIDRVVDVTLVPNPPAAVLPSGQFRPQPLFRQSDLWVQGVQFGVELRW